MMLDESSNRNLVDTVVISRFSFFLSSISIFTIWMFNQILDINLIRSFGFLHDDGWCMSGLITNPHCFGDFSIFISYWNNDINYLVHTYSPNMRVVFFIFENLLKYTSINVILFIYFISFLASLVFSWRIIKDINNELQLFDILPVVLGFGPLLFAIERGNSIIFSIFITLYLIKAIKFNNSKEVIIGSLLLISLKMQFIVILIPLLIIYKFYLIFKIIIFLTATNLASIMLLDGNIYEYIKKIVYGFNILAKTQDYFAEWPLNMSLSHVVNRLLIKSNIFQLEQLYITRYIILITLLVLLIYITVKYEKYIINKNQILIIWFMYILQLNVVLPYYNLVLLLPFAFGSLELKEIAWLKKRLSVGLNTIISLLIIFSGSIIPFFVNWNFITSKSGNSKIIYIDNTYIYNCILMIVFIIIYKDWKKLRVPHLG